MTNTNTLHMTRLHLPTLAWPVQVYFDASCRLCAAEMHNLRVRDQAQRLRFVDCSAPGFAAGPAPTAQLMQAMHCQDARGQAQGAYDTLLELLAGREARDVLLPFQSVTQENVDD